MKIFICYYEEGEHSERTWGNLIAFTSEESAEKFCNNINRLEKWKYEVRKKINNFINSEWTIKNPYPIRPQEACRENYQEMFKASGKSKSQFDKFWNSEYLPSLNKINELVQEEFDKWRGRKQAEEFQLWNKEIDSLPVEDQKIIRENDSKFSEYCYSQPYVQYKELELYHV